MGEEQEPTEVGKEQMEMPAITIFTGSVPEDRKHLLGTSDDLTTMLELARKINGPVKMVNKNSGKVQEFPDIRVVTEEDLGGEKSQ